MKYTVRSEPKFLAELTLNLDPDTGRIVDTGGAQVSFLAYSLNGRALKQIQDNSFVATESGEFVYRQGLFNQARVMARIRKVSGFVSEGGQEIHGMTKELYESLHEDVVVRLIEWIKEVEDSEDKAKGESSGRSGGSSTPKGSRQSIARTA